MKPRSTSLRWLWLIPGIALLVIGIVVGLSSHQVHQPKPNVYQKSTQDATTTYHISVGSRTKNVYISADGSTEYYVALNGDFNPPISQSDIDSSSAISFVARTDTTSVNVTINGTTVTQAHKIEQLIFYDNNGQTLSTYTTAEYTSYLADPIDDHFQNEWPIGITLILIGLLADGMTIIVLLSQRRTRNIPGFGVTMVGAYPPGYPQPYQGQPLYYAPLMPPYAPPYQAYPGQPGMPSTPPVPFPQAGAPSEQFGMPEGQIAPTQYARPPQIQE